MEMGFLRPCWRVSKSNKLQIYGVEYWERHLERLKMG